MDGKSHSKTSARHFPVLINEFVSEQISMVAFLYFSSSSGINCIRVAVLLSSLHITLLIGTTEADKYSPVLNTVTVQM